MAEQSDFPPNTSFWTNLPVLLFGHPSVFSLEHRVINFLCLLGSIIALINTVWNIILGLLIPQVITLTCTLVFGTTYYVSRIQRKLKGPTWTIIAMMLIITPPFWFTNSGSGGGYAYFLSICPVAIALLLGGTQRVITLIGFGLMASSLCLVEYAYPHLFMEFENRLSKYLDIMVGMLTSLAGISAYVIIFKKYYYEEKTRVEERTEELNVANQALEKSMEQLQMTQKHLVQSEKMAALGSLVGGVAHEVNTPVGIAVTAASVLHDETKELIHTMSAGQLTKSDLEEYTETATTSTELILNNLRRAADIVQSFKQVAVDQSSEERRRFKMKEYIEDVLTSLTPKFKRTKHQVNINCPQDMEIYSSPGTFSQIMTNLVINSLIHGFEHKEEGKITIEVSKTNGTLIFKYSDNGIGMNEDQVKRIFDPFFTTKRTKGGTGLGMHITFNLVTQTLGGEIECTSKPNEGSTFIIKIPNQE